MRCGNQPTRSLADVSEPPKKLYQPEFFKKTRHDFETISDGCELKHETPLNDAEITTTVFWGSDMLHREGFHGEVPVDFQGASLRAEFVDAASVAQDQYCFNSYHNSRQCKGSEGHAALALYNSIPLSAPADTGARMQPFPAVRRRAHDVSLSFERRKLYQQLCELYFLLHKTFSS